MNSTIKNSKIDLPEELQEGVVKDGPDSPISQITPSSTPHFLVRP